MKHFKNIKSYKDLKNQYKDLLKKNHPDNGGDVEVMKEINVEYDVLFKIWKDKAAAANDLTEEEKTETANSTRRHFYTANGWTGSRYDKGLALKEIAVIIRRYIKEKYPTYKFSVRTEYASMCQELHVEMKESPIEVCKELKDFAIEDWRELGKKIYCYDDLAYIDFLNAPEEQRMAIAKDKGYEHYFLNDITDAIIKDVNAFVNSYRYDDSDGMTDYFDTNFYYFGCRIYNIKIVPKTARIKNKNTRPAKAPKAKTEPKNAEQIASGYTYTIKKGEDTRDGSELWIVRINESLDKAAYIAESKAMKERGGYYSRFKHGFLFRFDPSEVLGIA